MSCGTADTLLVLQRPFTAITVTIQGLRHGLPPIQLHLGPDVLGARNVEYGVNARLVGDFAAFREPRNFEHKMLFIPAYPHTDERVVAPVPNEWMLVDNHRVSVDGRECNKIGVSYSAFAGQGSRCEQAVQSCLHNQLDDLRAEEQARAENGHRGLYMLNSFGCKGGGGNDMLNSFGDFFAFGATAPSSAGESFGATRPYIAYRVSHVQASLVTLTLVADNISFTVNVADGHILRTELATFEANSRDGRLRVVVQNIGNVAASFHVSVTACTSGLLPLQARVVSLAPRQITQLVFDVVSHVSEGRNHNVCNVTLLDALFAVVDSTTVVFNTSATVATEGDQGGTGGTGEGGPGLGPQNETPTNSRNSTAGCTDCPWYNPICFVTRQCFWSFATQIAVSLLGLLVAAVVVALAIKHRATLISWMGKLFRCLSGNSGEAAKGRNSPRQRSAEPYAPTPQYHRQHPDQRYDGRTFRRYNAMTSPYGSEQPPGEFTPGSSMTNAGWMSRSRGSVPHTFERRSPHMPHLQPPPSGTSIRLQRSPSDISMVQNTGAMFDPPQACACPPWQRDESQQPPPPAHPVVVLTRPPHVTRAFPPSAAPDAVVSSEHTPIGVTASGYHQDPPPCHRRRSHSSPFAPVVMKRKGDTIEPATHLRGSFRQVAGKQSGSTYGSDRGFSYEPIG